MGGERAEVVVLMADIRDFTPLSESMEPEELTTLLNDYFSEMVAAIHGHGGMVDKFIGDAIMAVFGLTGKDDNTSLAAVQSAQEMLTRLDDFNTKRSQSGKAAIKIGIGIHRGEVVAGYIGSRERLEFTVIGDTVNIAARIESHTKAPHPPLLFSSTVAEDIEQQLPVRLVTSARLKGVSREIALYTIEPL